MNPRRTKIVCTLGPASDAPGVMEAMIKEGMNVARVNFSHGTHEEHAGRVAALRAAREKLGAPVALLADTRGPEIRLGEVQPGTVLTAGERFSLVTTKALGDERRCQITYEGLPGDVKAGARILIDDGLIELEAESVGAAEICCRVLNGGPISSHKGVNVPGVTLNMPYIASRDRADLRFAAEQGFDFVAASFVRGSEDVLALRDELSRLGAREIKIIAKIENAQGVRDIDAIIAVSDGVMVARGDMGVEIALEEIPVLQKRLIAKASLAGKQVITATQMLESMVRNPRPTRAETTDVANAIYDGTSAIMLSGETAAGKYPVEATRTMARIALRTEQDIDYKERFRALRSECEKASITNAISHATCAAAHDLSAAAIITVTKSGETAKMISRFRPACPIIGCSPCEQVVRQMNLSWGVTPLLVAETTSADALFAGSVEAARASGLIDAGDLIVITAGVPLGVPGRTNMLRVHVVGEEI